jgi:hypothetical protein
MADLEEITEPPGPISYLHHVPWERELIQDTNAAISSENAASAAPFSEVERVVDALLLIASADVLRLYIPHDGCP